MCRSLRTIWIVMTPLSVVGLCCVLVARKYTLKRNVVKAGERPASAGNTEGGQTAGTGNNDGKIEDGTPEAVTAGDNVSTEKTEEAR
jgi:hypothetical protein